MVSKVVGEAVAEAVGEAVAEEEEAPRQRQARLPPRAASGTLRTTSAAASSSPPLDAAPEGADSGLALRLGCRRWRGRP